MSYSTENKRLQYIDVAKGLGIISVVIGHVYGGLSEFIYIFHMPFFFFVGGYLFKVKITKLAFFVDRTIQLLVPYLVYLLLIYSYQDIIFFKSNPLTLRTFGESLTRAILGGRWLSGYTTVFWFITCFFISQQLLNLILVKIAKPFIPGLMMVLLLVAYINSMFFSSARFPWDANVVLMSIPMFYIGYVIREYENIASKIIVCMAFLITFAAILLIILGFSNKFDMKNIVYGIPLITLISSIGITYVILAVSKFLTLSGHTVVLLATIGKASLVIMYLHQLIQLLINQNLTTSYIIRIFIAVAIPTYLFVVFEKSRFTRAFLLGSKQDFINIFKVNAKIGKKSRIK